MLSLYHFVYVVSPLDWTSLDPKPITFPCNILWVISILKAYYETRKSRNQEIFCKKRTYNKHKYHKGINTVSKSTQNHTKLPHTPQTQSPKIGACSSKVECFSVNSNICQSKLHQIFYNIYTQVQSVLFRQDDAQENTSI